MPTNLTDHLGELVDKVMQGPCRFCGGRRPYSHTQNEPVSGDYAELVGRLRKAETFCGPLSDVDHLFGEAATAIERLTADRDLWKQSEETCSRQHDLRAAEVERLTAREAELCEALKLAVKHIEHMASWIDFRGQGYNFESLGEDLPGIRARLSLGDEK